MVALANGPATSLGPNKLNALSRDFSPEQPFVDTMVEATVLDSRDRKEIFRLTMPGFGTSADWKLGASEEQQLRNYMTILNVKCRLLINFQQPGRKQGKTKLDIREVTL